MRSLASAVRRSKTVFTAFPGRILLSHPDRDRNSRAPKTPRFYQRSDAKDGAIPEYLLIIEGGYIGCEFASIYQTLGARVTLVEEKENLLPSWDAVAGDQIRHTLEAQALARDYLLPSLRSVDGSSKRLRGACALPAEPFRSTRTMRVAGH
jgi:hypothetical protein